MSFTVSVCPTCGHKKRSYGPPAHKRTTCVVCGKRIAPGPRRSYCSGACKNQAADRRRHGIPINNRDAKLWRMIKRLGPIAQAGRRGAKRGS